MRFYDAPEIVKVAAPVYLKYESGESIASHYKHYKGWETLARLARVKVKEASITKRIVERFYADAKMSAQGAPDLAIP
jgi:hypothetical protein